MFKLVIKTILQAHTKTRVDMGELKRNFFHSRLADNLNPIVSIKNLYAVQVSRTNLVKGLAMRKWSLCPVGVVEMANNWLQKQK